MIFMKIVNALWVLLLWVPLAWASPNPSVEIIIGGVHYASLQDYKDSLKHPQRFKGAASKEDEAFLRTETKRLGIGFDPKKVRTINLAPISQQTINRLESISYEHGVGRVMTDFQQNWDNPVPKFVIKDKDLEQRLEALADGRKEPVLIVSQAHKVRIVALDSTTVPAQSIE
jgi:hypothetical protein